MGETFDYDLVLMRVAIEQELKEWGVAIFPAIPQLKNAIEAHWPDDNNDWRAFLKVAHAEGVATVYLGDWKLNENSVAAYRSKLIDGEGNVTPEHEALLEEAARHLGEPEFLMLGFASQAGVFHSFGPAAPCVRALLLAESELMEDDDDEGGGMYTPASLAARQEDRARLEAEAAGWEQTLAEARAFQVAAAGRPQAQAAAALIPTLGEWLALEDRHYLRYQIATAKIYDAKALYKSEVKPRKITEVEDQMAELGGELAATERWRVATSKDERATVTRWFLTERIGFTMPRLVDPLLRAASAEGRPTLL